MSNIEKIIIGAIGGLSAVLVKFLGQDYATIVAHAADLTEAQKLSYWIGYGLLTPILMFLGALVAWASEEEKRLKLVALAIAAPALITTWAGGNKSDVRASADMFISSAYGQTLEAVSSPETNAEPGVANEKSPLDKIRDGVGVFFGYGNEPKRYWVIVGSYPDHDAAQEFADKINRSDSSLHAWVGITSANNKYIPVIVGNYSLLSEARVLREKALKNPHIKDAYLSSGDR
jgi:hypothetical protein